MTDTAAKKIQLGIVLFPDNTIQDLIGPHQTFAFHGETHLISNAVGPVRSDSGISLVSTRSYAQGLPEGGLDIVMVPGGQGTFAALQDQELVAFLRAVGPQVKYVTSVCTGTLTLAAAGLLDGYKATTHWKYYDLLETLGAGKVECIRGQRVVMDRNRFSGGGVTAGIDLGLTMLAHIKGPEVAQTVQLLMEYDPKPPFGAGSPLSAPKDIVDKAVAATKDIMEQRMHTAREIARRRFEKT